MGRGMGKWGADAVSQQVSRSAGQRLVFGEHPAFSAYETDEDVEPEQKAISIVECDRDL
jgi:hypothetical protein